jgi:hypothetical protein
MLPRKTGKPIAFKCTPELREQTEAIADSLGESLSDYVRKAVEERNARHRLGQDKPLNIPYSNTLEKEIGKPTIPEPKEKPKFTKEFNPLEYPEEPTECDCKPVKIELPPKTLEEAIESGKAVTKKMHEARLKTMCNPLMKGGK